MVFGKYLPDFGEADFENVANEEHCDLPGERDGPSVRTPLEIGDANAIVLGDKADDVCRIRGPVIGQKLEKSHANDVHGNLGVFELGVGDGSIETPFEFANVVLNLP